MWQLLVGNDDLWMMYICLSCIRSSFRWNIITMISNRFCCISQQLIWNITIDLHTFSDEQIQIKCTTNSEQTRNKLWLQHFIRHQTYLLDCSTLDSYICIHDAEFPVYTKTITKIFYGAHIAVWIERLSNRVEIVCYKEFNVFYRFQSYLTVWKYAVYRLQWRKMAKSLSCLPAIAHLIWWETHKKMIDVILLISL